MAKLGENLDQRKEDNALMALYISTNTSSIKNHPRSKAGQNNLLPKQHPRQQHKNPHFFLSVPLLSHFIFNKHAKMCRAITILYDCECGFFDIRTCAKFLLKPGRGGPLACAFFEEVEDIKQYYCPHCRAKLFRKVNWTGPKKSKKS